MDVNLSPDASPETVKALRSVGEAALDLMRSNAKCWSCGRWVRLRKDGTLGQHRTQGGNHTICEGTGKTSGESGLG